MTKVARRRRDTLATISWLERHPPAKSSDIRDRRERKQALWTAKMFRLFFDEGGDR